MNIQPSTSPTELPPSMHLSRDDVERLLRDDSSESRSTVLEKVALNYNAKTLTAREQEIAEHIFRLLMRDMSTRVRETLAERIKGNETIPRDIILHLAQDVETVARPVLSVSNVLSDADLVSIVEASQDMGKLLAISKRPQVSPRVSEALVETRYSQVVTSLLTNTGATFNTPTFNKIVTDFAKEDHVLEALASYPDLPMVVVERLISEASHAVAAELKEKYQISDSDLKEDANKVREEFMLRLLEGDHTERETVELVEDMARENTLSPSIIMTALCRGQLLFFTVALSHISGVSLRSATQLIADRGEHGFNGIYKKSGLPDSMADAVRLLLRAVQDLKNEKEIPGSVTYANRLVARVVHEAGDHNIEYLPYFIALIRQNAHRKN